MLRVLIHLVLAAIAVPLSISVGYGSQVSKAEFLVFDGLLYQQKPDLTSLGMHPIIQVNPPQGLYDKVYDAQTRDTMKTLGEFRGVVYLDYESWPLSGDEPEVIAGNVAKYNRVADIAHQTAPHAVFGFYGLLPCREYWGLVNNDRKKIDEWKECNRQGEIIANHVEVIFPSLYTFYNDQKSWDVYAKGMIEEARRYNKPVYVFLWPEFHVSNRILKGKEIPAKFWRHQLDLCRGLADGIVIWGGWQERWKEDAPWWIETKAFLATLSHP